MPPSPDWGKMWENFKKGLPIGVSPTTGASVTGPSQAQLAGVAATAAGGIGAAATLPWYALLAAGAAGAQGLKSAGVSNPFSGGGSGSDKKPPRTDSPFFTTSDLLKGAAGTGGAAPAPTLDIESYLAAMAAADAAGGGGSGSDNYGVLSAADKLALEQRGLDISQFEADTGRYNADTNRYSAEVQAKMTEAQIADLMYQRTVDEAQLALQRGDLQLAREKFEDSKIWSARAADAQDESNRLTGIGRQIDAYGQIGNLNLGALDVQNDAYSSAGNLTNDATGLQLQGLNQAGNLELGGYATQGDILGAAGNLGVNNFSAVEDAIFNRGSLQARGAENYSNLTNILGNLGIAQQQLGLDIATTPRNAIAGFLMGRGQSGQGAEMFNPANILGINPAQIQQVIQQAMASAGQVGQNLPAMQQFNAGGIINGMVGAANNAASTGAANAAGIRGVANQAPGRVAMDANALRQVGASAPGAIQSAVSGLSNAAASVAQRTPATVPGAATSANPYSAMYNKMVAGGAPQIAIDQLRNTAAAAGYGL